MDYFLWKAVEKHLFARGNTEVKISRDSRSGIATLCRKRKGSATRQSFQKCRPFLKYHPFRSPVGGGFWSRSEVDRSKAVGYLNKVLQSSRVAEVEFEEANRLLKKFGSK
jgi:hypothetical protein